MQFDFASERRITLIPVNGRGNPADFALAMFRSNAADAATWAQPRNAAVASADVQSGGGIEQLRYRHVGGSDYLGLAVVNKTPGTSAQFYVQVTPSSLFSSSFDPD